LYPEGTQPDCKWRIQAVPLDSESFQSRKALPESWRGIRDGALDVVTGIKGCVFVHAAGFIGGESHALGLICQVLMRGIGNATREGAMEMAIKAIDM
jgi:uncharacterized UPF0160 family protein